MPIRIRRVREKKRLFVRLCISSNLGKHLTKIVDCFKITAMDWRSLGAVTDVHSQSSCGACWAITAVETVESAYFISKGKLYDLAETEVIVCETNGEMCSGGWPQDAFDYVIKHNGLPLESDMPYNADFLVKVSDQIAGNSDQLEYVLADQKF